jgi:hypothetical protein
VSNPKNVNECEDYKFSREFYDKSESGERGLS